MSSIKKSYSKAGYDQEECYFYKVEQELIKKMRSRPQLSVIQGGKEQGGGQANEVSSSPVSRKKAA